MPMIDHKTAESRKTPVQYLILSLIALPFVAFVVFLLYYFVF